MQRWGVLGGHGREFSVQQDEAWLHRGTRSVPLQATVVFRSPGFGLHRRQVDPDGGECGSDEVHGGRVFGAAPVDGTPARTLPRPTSAWRKHPTSWSFTMPAACMYA